MQRYEREIPRPTLDSGIAFRKKTLSASKDSSRIVSLPITEPKTPASVLEAPQLASITELTHTLKYLENSDDNREKFLALKKIRQGKAINLLRKQKGGGPDQFTKNGISTNKLKAVESGNKELSLQELDFFIMYFEDSAKDFYTSVLEIEKIIEVKEPESLIENNIPLLSLIKTTGSSYDVLANILNKPWSTTRKIIFNLTPFVSVNDIHILLEHVKNKRKEKDEAINVLQSDAHELREKKKINKNVIIGDSLRNIRNIYGLTQQDISDIPETNLSQETIALIESGKRTLKEKEAPELMKKLKSYDINPKAIEIQIMESCLPKNTKNMIFVSQQTKRASKLFKEIIENIETPIPLQELADSINISVNSFEKFKNGKIAEPNSTLIIDALNYYLDPEDINFLELKKILTERQDTKKWIKTLVERSPDEIITFLRLSTYSSIEAFSKKTVMNNTTIHLAEKNKNHKMELYNLNDAINASAIGELGSDSIAAQLCRAEYFKIKLKSCDDLKNWTKDDLLTYIYPLIGLTPKEVQKKLNTNNYSLEDFLTLINLSPQDEYDNALLQVVKYMFGEVKEITPDDYKKAVLGKYLFTEQLNDIQPYDWSLEDLELGHLLMSQTSGEIIRTIRHKKGLTIKELSNIISHDRIITTIEHTQAIGRDYILAEIMLGLGYDIHHPLTQGVLDKAKKERLRETNILSKEETVFEA